jgi:hypothetical protein
MNACMHFEYSNFGMLQYHAILGRPGFARFMAIPHCAYLVLKIPGPNEVIILKGNFVVSDTFDKEFH